MDIKAEKLKLIQAVLDIEEMGLRIDLQNYISSYGDDWFDGLREDQQQSVMKSLEQADRGEGIPHEEVAKRLGL
jgi:hypothetical protein